MRMLAPLFMLSALLLVPSAGAQPAPMPPPEERGADRRADVDEELTRAREALAEAARRVAELSVHETERFMRSFQFNHLELPPVRLGITVGEATDVGVAVAAVTDGGPAARAGIQPGDLLVEVNGVSVAGPVEPGAPATRRVQQALMAASPGDEVSVRYRRGRRTHDAKVAVDAAPSTRAFAYRFGDTAGTIEMPPMPPMEHLRFRRPFGNYELVRVTPELGRYFNTERGLLVVRVGDDNPLTLQDGDVILTIDGREPDSPTHAARILRSYVPGETVKLEIMRQRRRETLEVAVPQPRRTATMLRDAAPGLSIRAAE